MARMPVVPRNPFRPGAGLRPPYLAGRDAEKEAMSEMLLDLDRGMPRNLLLYGLRGMGKTVLLDEYATMCTESGFLPVAQYQYSEEHSDPERFFEAFGRSVDEASHKLGRLGRARERIRSAAEYVKPAEISVSGVAYGPSYGTVQSASLADRIIDHMAGRMGALGEGCRGVIFLFDEFHTIRRGNDGESVLGNFVAAVNEMQRSGIKCSAVLSGLPALLKNVKEARSYSERMFLPLEIANLDHGKAEDAIRRPLEGTGLSFSEGLVSAITEDTDRYPFFIQFFAKEVIDRTGGDAIGLDEYESVRRGILEKLGLAFFSQRLATVSRRQLEMLRLMASIPREDVQLSDIVDKSGMARGSAFNHLKRLAERGLVRKSGAGSYGLAMPLLRAYLLGLPPG